MVVFAPGICWKTKIEYSENFKEAQFGEIICPVNQWSNKIIGFIVGLVPLLRNSLIGDEAALRVIEHSTTMIGNAVVPVLTLIIGANLLRGLRASGVQKSMVVGIIVARYIALPLICTLVVKIAVRLNSVHADPVYQFVLLLQFVVPPAMNMGKVHSSFTVVKDLKIGWGKRLKVIVIDQEHEEQED
ncbi:protein PIN-LIKES 1-like [Apium graveolens]|uniref:protein PIN-LIKES 1-like n=1 Tax=Apium graveolens TaxID=4045 RepID=UPI003D7B3DC2